MIPKFIANINKDGIDSTRSDSSIKSSNTMKDIMMVGDEAAASDDMKNKGICKKLSKIIVGIQETTTE